MIGIVSDPLTQVYVVLKRELLMILLSILKSNHQMYMNNKD